MDQSTERNDADGSKMQKYLSPKKMIVEGKFKKEEVVFYPAVCDFLPEEFIRKARKELAETDKRRTVKVQELRELIMKENLPYAIDDNFLLMFLRCKKFNLRKAKEKLKGLYYVNRLLMNYVDDIDMKKVHTILDTYMLGVLPYRDRNGCAICYTNGLTWNSDHVSAEEFGVCVFALFMFMNSFPMSSVCGLNYICEATSHHIRDMYSMTMFLRKRMRNINALPIRFQRIDTINENSFVHYIVKIAYPFLSSKLRQRIHFHGKNMDQLKKFYHPSLIPSEFGGSFGPLDNSSYKERFIEYLLKMKSMKKRNESEDSRSS